MLFLQLPLLLALLPGADSEDGFQEPVSFQIIRIFSFYNHSWEHSLGSGWLGELQTHSMDSSSDTVIYLWPWSRGNFSNEELMEVTRLFQTFFIRFAQAFHNHAIQWMLHYPFEVQIAGGCKLRFGEASVGFVQVAFQGSEFLSFQNNSWLPSPEGGEMAQLVSSLFNLYQGTSEILHRLLSDTCPRFLLGLLDAGKAYLQRQGHRSSVGWIFLAVTVPLLLLAGLAFWVRKRWTLCQPASSHLPLE
nr:T-cell surface glycoprotein CD1a-like [Vicugna pacos]